MQHNAHTAPAKAVSVKETSPRHGKTTGAMRRNPHPRKQTKQHHKQG